MCVRLNMYVDVCMKAKLSCMSKGLPLLALPFPLTTYLSSSLPPPTSPLYLPFLLFLPLTFYPSYSLPPHLSPLLTSSPSQPFPSLLSFPPLPPQPSPPGSLPTSSTSTSPSSPSPHHLPFLPSAAKRATPRNLERVH